MNLHWIDSLDSVNKYANVFLVLITALVWAATHNLVKESKKASQLELRAYISFARFQSRFFLNSAGSVDTWRFDPLWENSGATFTQNFYNHVSWKSYPAGESPQDENFPDLGSQVHARLVAGSKVTVLGQSVMVRAADLTTWAQTGARFFIWGWAEYDDVFSTKKTSRHRTQFCVSIELLGDPTRTDCFFGFNFHNDFNGADGEISRVNR